MTNRFDIEWTGLYGSGYMLHNENKRSWICFVMLFITKTGSATEWHDFKYTHVWQNDLLLTIRNHKHLSWTLTLVPTTFWELGEGFSSFVSASLIFGSSYVQNPCAKGIWCVILRTNILVLKITNGTETLGINASKLGRGKKSSISPNDVNVVQKINISGLPSNHLSAQGIILI